MKRRRAARLLLAVAAAAHLHCGGGGGGGGGGPTAPPTPTPVPTPVAITFTATGTGGANALALTRVQGDQTSIVLSLEVTSVTDLYGVAFDLQYPSSVLAFDGVTEGSFLNQNSTVSTSLQEAETPSGTLIIGLTRLGQVSGRTGTGSLLQFAFSRRAQGSGDLSFAGNQAFDSTGAVIPGVVWSAGSVVVP